MTGQYMARGLDVSPGLDPWTFETINPPRVQKEDISQGLIFRTSLYLFALFWKNNHDLKADHIVAGFRNESGTFHQSVSQASPIAILDTTLVQP
jgi:hypothetical protein